MSRLQLSTMVMSFAALVAVYSVDPVWSRTIDPCAKLQQLTRVVATPHQEAAFKEKVQGVLQSLLRWLQPEPSADSPPAPIMFTTRSGFARLTVCSGAVATERSLFYPVGLVVQKIGEATFTVGGQTRDYAYVIAEYGMRLFIRQDHLRVVEPDNAYIFTNSVVPTSACPMPAPCAEDDAVRLEAKRSYGVAKRAELIAPPDDHACRWIPIEIVGNETARSGFWQNCLKGGEAELRFDAETKIVTHAVMTEILAAKIDGSFHRFGAKIASAYIPFLLATKPCANEVTSSQNFTLGSELGVDVPLKLIQVGGKVNMSRELSNVTTYPSGRYYLFSTYAYALKVGDKSWEGFQDIQTIAKCDEDNISAARAVGIRLWHKAFPNEEIGLRVRLMEDAVQREIERMPQSAALAPDAVIHRTEDHDLALGRFWEIRTADEYFIWRNALQNWMLRKVPQIEGIVSAMSTRARIVVHQFFAHLVLASAFNFNINT